MLAVDPMLTLVIVVFIATTLLATMLLWRRRREPMNEPLNIPPLGYPKVVIFYSSIGAGHISAADSIKREILRQEPQAMVVLQDIRAFMSPVRRRIDERLYWFVANNLSECFETLFWTMQEEGNATASLANLPNDYPEDKVLAFLRTEKPHTVLSTHYGSAQVLGTLRERGLLPHMKIGWLHTDYFEGYFPRISKRIDRTFLAHPELILRWVAAGVPADLIDSSGMPVCVSPPLSSVREATMAELGLDPSLTTILMIGGKGGIGDYFGVAKAIAAAVEGPSQFVALCGTNARMVELLVQLSPLLAPRLIVRPFGLIPQFRVIECMRIADVLVTKAGGLTPAEAFSIGIPTVLLDVLSGHERENAELFVRLGLAELAADAQQAGQAVARLLGNEEGRAAMLAAQTEFGRNSNVDRIAAFALDPAIVPRRVPVGFGTENGLSAENVDVTLAQIDAEASAQVELLLSYSTAKGPERIVRENPFGHLAIRVGDQVLSANHMVTPHSGASLLQHATLADFLFGVAPPGGKQEHVSTYGMAYGRDTLGLRVMGVPESAREAMLREAEQIEIEFQAGEIAWNRRDFNCADAVARILEAGGFPVVAWSGVRNLPTMPLDVFDQALLVFQEELSLKTELIAYRKLIGSQANYQFSRFPLSITQPLRSIARLLVTSSPDALEAAVTRQVRCYGDRRLFVEELSPRMGALRARSRLPLEQALKADAARLLKTRMDSLRGDEKGTHDPRAIQELRQAAERGRDLARLATERAEEVLIRPRANRLRHLFCKLEQEFVSLGKEHWQPAHFQIYLRHLQDFDELLRDYLLRFQDTQQRLRTKIPHHLRRMVWRIRRNFRYQPSDPTQPVP